MKHASVTLSLPWGGHSSTIFVSGRTYKAMLPQITEAVRAFARRRGVSPVVVERSVAFG